MVSYLLSSHDGFGLGHVRRNVLIARSLLDRDPSASVTIATGVSADPGWLDDPRIHVVRVPPLLKALDGSYRNAGMSFESAVARRAAMMSELVERLRPQVIVVDRHPYGTGGELLPALSRARALGSRLVLGLRDILDEPAAVAAELFGAGWQGVAEMFDDVLVYGGSMLCDHEAEYGLPITPTYCGWVTETAPTLPVEDHLLVVSAGGGGDGERVFRLGVGLLKSRRNWHGIIVSGPCSSRHRSSGSEQRLGGRLTVGVESDGCAHLYARAGAVVQMAGYNSTYEALAAGVCPILMPRRNPRREQAIRASRLAALGLAHVIDDNADADEAAWLLDRPLRLAPGALAAAGVRLDGAERAAAHIEALAQAGV